LLPCECAMPNQNPWAAQSNRQWGRANLAFVSSRLARYEVSRHPSSVVTAEPSKTVPTATFEPSLMHRLRIALALFACLLLAGCVGDGGSSAPGSAVVSNLPGPQGAEEGVGRKQLWLIPSPQSGAMMRAVLYRPPGDGPFPLAVVNHG